LLLTSKGGMGLAVVPARAGSGQSRQAPNEERAQV
jgi:hypothetical protein